MKPAPFEYVAPESLEEALSLLDEGSRPLAGGQSLVPQLNARRARPRRLVDLNRIAGRNVLQVDGGSVRIGLLVRQSALLELDGWPLLREAARHVGHPATRTRGTICGSVANAAPAAELPAALTALDARCHVRSAGGARSVPVAELLAGGLAPDELLVEIEVPPQPKEWRFAEYARTYGAWPIVGAAAAAGGRIAPFGVGRAGVCVSSIDELASVVDDPWKLAYLREALA